ncbi:CotH protein [compost metagenome]
MKKITLFLVPILLLLVANASFAQGLVINEVITSNSDVIVDDDGSYEDWIEIYNGSAESINLDGYGLTDNSDLFQWTFPNKTILPGEHLLIWCSDKNRVDPDSPLHTNFKISSGGEVITLTDNDGDVVDSYPAVSIPQNYTYGRATDGASSFVIFPEPTPGTANITVGYSEILDTPIFSKQSGFYEDAFNLTMSSVTSGATIIYTLDGSEPDENNLLGTTYKYKNKYPKNPGDGFGSLLQKTFITLTYTNPISIYDRSSEPNKISSISTTYDSDPTYIPENPVLKGTSVRAKVIKPGAMASKTITQNYFISPQGENLFSLPVAAINIDENLLFGYNEGIHVAGKDFDQWRTANPDDTTQWCDANYDRSGDDWEVKGNFSYYANGSEVINQDTGLRIHGGTTRAYPNKSLRLYARSEFGKGSFDYPFFGENEDDSYKRLILRNAGNDASTTYFLDAFIHKSVSHLNFDTQSYQPTITFINGEFWGMLNLRERYDKHYFERVYGIEDDVLDHIEIAGIIEAKEGDLDHYSDLIDFVENNSLSDDENYTYITTQIDPENFADYYITEIYINNTDWLANNVELFRKKTDNYEPNAPHGQDGRWRWILKDTDVSFGLVGSYTHNTLAFATEENGPSYPNPAWATLLFRKMLENSEFKNYFINRFADLLNTTFLPSRLQTIYDGLKNNIASEIPKHIERWGAIGSVENWNNYCSAIINYAHQRPDHQRNHIRQEFAITDNLTATLNVSNASHGYIAMNTIDINSSTQGVDENPYPWTGIYFQNVPVTLKAVALPGFKFSHWSGDINSTEIEVVYIPTANFSVTAHFIPAPVVATPKPIYFWVFDSAVTNDTALTSLNSTFEIDEEATLEYQSCLEGYPFNDTHPNWRKASMERRNSPTDINYIPKANNDVLFADSNMKGIQIKQPFHNNGSENAMIFNLSTSGYKDVFFAFAAKDEGAANAIFIDYSIDSASSTWITTGLETSLLSLTDDYELYEVSFASISGVNDNPDFKIRLRFTGTDMTIDEGNRVTFNNISVIGTSINAAVNEFEKISFTVFPNPVSDVLSILHQYDKVDFKIFSMDGKLIKENVLTNNQIDLAELQRGVYLLELSSEGNYQTKRIIKK